MPAATLLVHQPREKQEAGLGVGISSYNRQEAMWLPKVRARSDLQTGLHSVPSRPHRADPWSLRGLCQPSGEAAWLHRVDGGLRAKAVCPLPPSGRTPKRAIALQLDIHSFPRSLAHPFVRLPAPSFIHAFVHSADSGKIFLRGLEHVSRPCWAVMAPMCPGTLTSAHSWLRTWGHAGSTE